MSLRDHLQGAGRRSGRDSRPSHGKILSAAIILVVLLSILIFFIIKGCGGDNPPDPITLCPTDRPPSEVTVLILDLTDEFSEPQKIKILNEIERIQTTIPQFGLIEVYTINQLDRRVVTPVIHLCNPGNGAEMSPIYENPAMAFQRWKSFLNQLDTELSKLMSMPESPTSPIFEVIQATALRTFNKREYDGIPKRLVIVSDLIQNVPGKLTQVSEILPFTDFKNTDYFTEVRCDLRAVQVYLYYLVRTNKSQKWPDHKIFWEQYFLSQGASVEKLEPIYGPK